VSRSSSSWPALPALSWAALACGLVAACSSRDIVATSVADPDPPIPDYCQSPGPVILVGDGITVGDSDGTANAVCTGTVAVLTFDRALCTCEGYGTATTLDTDSFDSSLGPYASGGTEGNVGLDGGLRSNAVITIGGSLAVAGTAGVAALADLHVAHDLDIAGPLGTGVTVRSGGDAHLAGNVDLDLLTVAGTLEIPAEATISGPVTAGSTVRTPVTIEPPCACAASDLVDIEAFVAAHATDNQDAVIGLTPDRLTDYHGAVTLDLPCGIYYVGPVRGDGALTLRVTGRAALLVDGDLSLTAPFTVELDTEDAELDLMIGGLLSSNHAIVIGRADHPARTRVYVGGTGTINLSGDSELATNFYAPRAAVALSGAATVFGSLFVKSLEQAAPIKIHYDVNVRRADVGCPLF